MARDSASEIALRAPPKGLMNDDLPYPPPPRPRPSASAFELVSRLVAGLAGGLVGGFVLADLLRPSQAAPSGSSIVMAFMLGILLLLPALLGMFIGRKLRLERGNPPLLTPGRTRLAVSIAALVGLVAAQGGGLPG